MWNVGCNSIVRDSSYLWSSLRLCCLLSRKFQTTVILCNSQRVKKQWLKRAFCILKGFIKLIATTLNAIFLFRSYLRKRIYRYTIPGFRFVFIFVIVFQVLNGMRNIIQNSAAFMKSFSFGVVQRRSVDVCGTSSIKCKYLCAYCCWK